MIATTLESLYGKDFMTDTDRIWEHIEEGREYWILLPGNHPMLKEAGVDNDVSWVDLRPLKIVVTEKRTGFAIYKAVDYPQTSERVFEKGSVMCGELMPVVFCPEKELSEETLKIIKAEGLPERFRETFDERYTKIIHQ